MTGPNDLAVVGSGVTGLTAAYIASFSARVTLYEADTRLGGHADTHRVRAPDGTEMAIDTGFIVHNRRTYPTLIRLFDELGVPTQPSEMSLSTRSDASGVEYAGARGWRGLLPDRRALRPAHLGMLAEVPRFHRRARAFLAADSAEDQDQITVADFARRHGFSAHFRRHFLTPLVAAVWSCDPAFALDYPARYLFRFLEQHGMLQVFGSPRWRTVTGGSAAYVDRVEQVLRHREAEVCRGTKITSAAEQDGGVVLTDGNGAVHRHDAVVLATHPGQALAILARPTAAQREILGALGYAHNLAVLHTDTSLLPRNPRTRASWNHLERPEHDGVTVTYDLTRLMCLPTPGGVRHLVTLGGHDLVDPGAVLDTMEYEHPVYTPESVAALRRADELDSDRIVVAGAWRGWGFHEDGARAGAGAARRLGFGWPAAPREEAPSAEGVYRTTITHRRRRPRANRFVHRSHWWVVDVDEPPDRGLLGRFEARDHLGSPEHSIRENLAAFLDRHGVDLGRGRVLMAAQPRALGFCFNPISVFWCHDEAGSPLATVVEVHNTYGDRHAYLVRPDARGRGRVDKAMYVSPFHGVAGHYDLSVPRPDGSLRVAVRLTTGDEVFDAAVRGERVRRPNRLLLARAAAAGAVGAFWIQLHGIALWLRGLPVQPRPTHHQEGVR